MCVFGLASGCAATAVARALSAELAGARPGWHRRCAVRGWPGGIPLATHAATRLARVLEDLPRADPRAVGRQRVVGGADTLRLANTAPHHAPLVIDAGSDALGGPPASLADRTVIVTTQNIEPALVRVAADCIARVAPVPVVVGSTAHRTTSPACSPCRTRPW